MTIEFESVIYGLIPEGFRVMPQPVCQRYITARLIEVWEEDITANDIDFDSNFGQWIASESEQLAENFEIAESLYNAFDPDLAFNDALDKICRIVGVYRDPGTFTKVYVLCEGTPGTILDAGKIVSVPDTEEAPGPKFKLPAQTTIEAGGTLAAFEALERGAVKVFAGQISVIETPVIGWTSASNPEDGVVGNERELNSALRVRRQEHIKAGGSGRPDAIKFAVANVEGVTSVKVYENDTDVVNERGQPKRSIEVVVNGGDPDAIAQALWDKKAGATPYVGNTFGTAVDAEGESRDIPFTRSQLIPIYVTYEIEIDPDEFPFDGEDTIKINTVVRGETLLGEGDDVIVDPFLKGNLADIPGILSNIIKVGLAPNPTESDDIPIADTEKADFDTSRTVVVFS